MTRLAPITLPRRLKEEARHDAVYLLRKYFAGPLAGSLSGFEGGHWDNFDPSGTRDSSPNQFTADDLLSASLLSADIPAKAVVRILNDEDLQMTLSRTLRDDLGQDRDLASLTDTQVRELESKSTIWTQLRRLPGVGPTRTSKLIARKRPRLIPIYDSLVGAAVYGGSTIGYWTRMHAALTANDAMLHEQLVLLREQAGLEDYVSPLRVFDVIAWLDASGKGDELLRGRDRDMPVEGL